MGSRLTGVLVAGLLGVVAAGSCRTAGGNATPIVQPGAPGQPSRVITAEKAADIGAVRHSQADVRFMQGMIGHHAQAIEMVSLLDKRTTSDDMRKLGHRIELSQRDEIKMMEGWLTRRGEKLPDPHAHHGPGAALMPGMLTPEEMNRLAAARGPAFDRLFLEFMIKHHEGALSMVRDLFATAGAGQEPDAFAFASDVDADQRMEIDRMMAMLQSMELSK